MSLNERIFEMNATTCNDPTLEIPSVQLALLRMESSSPKTLCMLTGELLANEQAFNLIPAKVFSRLNEEELMEVIEELIEQAEDDLANDEPIDLKAAEALRCATLGVTFMGNEGSEEFYRRHNYLLDLLIMVDGAVNLS